MHSAVRRALPWLRTSPTIAFKLANRRARVLVRISPDRDTIHGNTSDPAIDDWLVEHHFANDDVQLVASA